MTQTEIEILAVEEIIKKADTSRDSDTSPLLDELLADDVVLVGPQGQIFDKAYVLKAHQPPKKQTYDSITVTELIMKDLGELAIVYCRCLFEQQTKLTSLRFMRVWQKVEGNWKLVSGTVTAII